MAFSLADMVQGNATGWPGMIQQTPVAITATNDGLTTGVIAAGTSSALVTSSSASNYATLPTPNPGDAIVITVGANGFRLQTSTPASIAINGVSGGGSYLQVPANSILFVRCLTATTFAVFIFTSNGALDTGIDAYLAQTVSSRLCHTGNVVPMASTPGTDTTPVTTETYFCEVEIPSNRTVNGIAIHNGSAVAGNMAVALADAAGTILASSISTAVSGTEAYQRVDFQSAYAAKGPGTFYVLLQSNNTGNRFRTHSNGNFGANKKTGETFGTFTNITPPTTFTASLGPIASLY